MADEYPPASLDPPAPDPAGQVPAPPDASAAADRPASAEPAPTGEAPATGDLVIDAALRDLAAASADDLDAVIGTGEQVQRTLQSRLGDLGG